MSFGDYRLIQQLGAGRDGIAYRALGSDGATPFEICDLSAARRDPERWAELSRRIRLASQLDHPGVVGVVEARLAEEPPYVALEWIDQEKNLSNSIIEIGVRIDEANELVRRLAGATAEAHRIGLTHGSIDLSRIAVDGNGRPRLDFTGIETGPASAVADDGRPGDVAALGRVWVRLLGGAKAEDVDAGPHSTLLRAMLHADPEERPTAREVEAGLAPARRSTEFGETIEHETDSILALTSGGRSTTGPGVKLGRYTLREVLGAGGQGVVYRAEDTAEGTVVAVKVLRPEWASRPEAARRFRKEARMMARFNNPHVVNLLDYNDEGGVAYLVMEYVVGRSLGDRLEQPPPLDEPSALALAIDVARALEGAHEQGIVHRDVKPANVLLADDPAAPERPRVKLSDFGLARHVVDSESLALTAPGARLGTPHYMAPEQITGRPVDPRTDVYALGATLFHMVSGRPPFAADTREQLHVMHLETPPPPLRTLVATVSDGLCRVVERALAKSPDDRYPDAAALRRDLERLARGEPTGLPLHPALPPCDPRRMHDFEFRWDLESSPRQLWPYVANTDRLDRALGFAPVAYRYGPDPDRKVRLFAESVKAGQHEAWEEFPYEWVEPRRMGVYREYSSGPFHWLVSTVDLEPRPEGGTTLVHRLRLEPRGLKSRVFSPVGVGVLFRTTLGRVYERIDAALSGKLGPSGSVDPFEAPPELDPDRRERLERRLDQLAGLGVDPTAVELLGDLLAHGSAQELARIRPRVLARRWGLGEEALLAACLHASRQGLLVLLWDILCPTCRVSCEMADTLRAIREHGRCEACQADFGLDFARSIELVFRAHPEVREADVGLYCAGGPAHAPHVVAQVRVGAGERLELELTLPKGAYRLRGPQLPWSVRFSVQPDATARSAEVDLSRGGPPDDLRRLAPGGQVLILANPSEHELLARVERDAERDDALTAMQALAFAAFRDLYPGEVLSPGQLVSVQSVALLASALDGAAGLYETLGEAWAFAVIHDHFRIIDDAVRRGGGALVKTIDEGVVAAFPGVESAAAVALGLHAAVAGNESTRELTLKMALHCGPALVSTLDGRLDYFGAAARRVREVLRHAGGGEIVMTVEASGDPAVAAMIRARGLDARVVDAGTDGRLHRLKLI